MIKNFVVDATFNNMRLDRFLRNKLGKIPQGLIEKKLRTGKIKLNNSTLSFKVTLVELFTFFLLSLIFPVRNFFSIKP